MTRRSGLGQCVEIALVVLVLVFAGAEYGALYTTVERSFDTLLLAPADSAGLDTSLPQR